MKVHGFTMLFAALTLLAAPSAGAQGTVPPAPPASSPAAAASAPAGATVVPEAAPAFRVPAGWRVKSVRGEELRYCRKDVRLGSRFAKEECLTRDQLELQLKVDSENASRVSQGARVCASAPGCGGN
jgi:hypothetical protein